MRALRTRSCASRKSFHEASRQWVSGAWCRAMANFRNLRNHTYSQARNVLDRSRISRKFIERATARTANRPDQQPSPPWAARVAGRVAVTVRTVHRTDQYEDRVNCTALHSVHSGQSSAQCSQWRRTIKLNCVDVTMLPVRMLLIDVAPIHSQTRSPRRAFVYK